MNLKYVSEMRAGFPLEAYPGDLAYELSSGLLYINLEDNTWAPLYLESGNSQTPESSVHTELSRCPMCGAPHDPYSIQCEYCGSYFI